jgi:hypothetical protein
MIKMKEILTIILLLTIQFSLFSQENKKLITNIEQIDSLLIGKKIKKAFKLLDIDSNWTVIHEPPMIIQGVRVNNNEYEIQFITERISWSKFKKDKETNQKKYSKIVNYKIIGISWRTIGKCKSIGDIIPQFAFDKFGPCDNKKLH